METWAAGATDLELLNWMRSQHQMPPLAVGTFLVILCILFETEKLCTCTHYLPLCFGCRSGPHLDSCPTSPSSRSPGMRTRQKPPQVGARSNGRDTGGGVAPGSSHPAQEELEQPPNQQTTPAPGVSGLGYFTLFLPCTVQCNHCEHPTHF